MSKATKLPPDGYTQTGGINLKTQKSLAVWMNVAAFLVLIPVILLLIGFLRAVHPGDADSSVNFALNFHSLMQFLLFVLAVIVMLLLHEAIHGVGFLLATGEQPKYGLSLSYAYAAAPAWYIPADIYFWIGIAPLLVIDTVGLLLIWLLPASAAWLATVVVALNTAGAVGDVYILCRLLRSGKDTLVNDSGDQVLFYTLNNSASGG